MRQALCRSLSRPYCALLGIAASALLMNACSGNPKPPPEAVVAAPAASQQAIEARAEARAIGWVEAYNTGDPDIYERWMQENRAAEMLATATPAERKASLADLREMFGEMMVIGVLAPSAFEIQLATQTEKAGRFAAIFRHDETADAKILTIRFQPQGPEIELGDDWADLSALLGDFLEPSGSPAWAAAVVHGGAIVDAAAAGLSDVETAAPIDLETSRFHWGSVTKSVTGTMIGKLVEEGVLDWDTTVADIFGEDNVRTEYLGVTIAQLMGHRAGIPGYDNFDDDFMRDLGERYPGSWQAKRAGWVRDVLAHDAPIYPPGKGWRYSNAGITIAGVMAEIASGESWENLVKTRVFEPLGMASAGFGWPRTAAAPDQTQGYFGNDPDALEPAAGDGLDGLVEVLGPAGNVQSTIKDFAIYAAAHLAGMEGKEGVLSAKTMHRLHNPSEVPAGAPELYSFGWGQAEAPDGATMHWHNGGAGTFYAEVRIIPEHDLAIVLMTNSGYGEQTITPLWQAIYRRYAQE